MKRWAMVAALVLAAGTAGATDMCSAEGTLAEGIMAMRQAGFSIAEVRAKVDHLPIKDLYEQMIIEAFDSHRYLTEQMQDRTQEEFRNRWQVKCIKEGREN